MAIETVVAALPMIPGNRVSLRVGDRETFRTARELVQGARASVAFETFTLNGPEGRGVAEALIAAHRRGIVVQVVLDSKAMRLPDERRLVAAMQEAGVAVHSYEERHLFDPLVAIDHAKLLVVDGERALVGGTNYDDPINFDLNFLIQGPALEPLLAQFRQSWRDSRPLGPQPGDTSRVAGPAVAAPADGDTRMAVTETAPRNDPGEPTTLPHVLAAMGAAEEAVDVLMYNMDDPQEIAALAAAATRGVSVRVILDPGNLRGPLGWLARHAFNLLAIRRLLAAGITVRRYRCPPGIAEMHAKVAIFDRRLLLGGSTNWVHSSNHDNHEIGVWLTGPVVDEAVRIYERVWSESVPVTHLSHWDRARATAMELVAKIL